MEKIPKKLENVYGLFGLIGLGFIVVALITHDWFYLATAYVLGGNLYRVINYNGSN